MHKKRVEQIKPISAHNRTDGGPFLFFWAPIRTAPAKKRFCTADAFVRCLLARFNELISEVGVARIFASHFHSTKVFSLYFSLRSFSQSGVDVTYLLLQQVCMRLWPVGCRPIVLSNAPSPAKKGDAVDRSSCRFFLQSAIGDRREDTSVQLSLAIVHSVRP